MKNISINGEPIHLNTDKTYWVIDALYVDEIIESGDIVNSENIDEFLRKKIFPYTDTPFTKYQANNSVFEVSAIRRADIDTAKDLNNLFSTDSGIVLFIADNIFLDFIKRYSYQDLTDSVSSEINEEYWKKLTAQYENHDLAIVVSPGIESNMDFDGSGTYRIS